jgi:cytidylate kinase
MRIARALSLLGFCSRREAERLIQQGRVSVDGHRVEGPATLVDPTVQTLRVDGKASEAPTRRVYLAVHKPVGVTSTVRDPHAERTVSELAPGLGRLYPVGRLDKDSEGLILLTNDGEFANRVSHPRYGVSREYLAMVPEAPRQDALRKLKHGIVLDGRRATPSLVELAPRGGVPPDDGRVRGVWVRIVLREGRNREVRRLLAAVGCPVLRLVRTRIGPVRLSGIRPGQYRPLRPREVQNLLTWARPGRDKGEMAEEDDIAEAPAVGDAEQSESSGHTTTTLDADDAPLSAMAPERIELVTSAPESGAADDAAERGFVVAIDGPAAAGKTTVGRLVARRIGAVFLDTGVLYRALTWAALQKGIDLDDAALLAGLAAALDVRVSMADSADPAADRIQLSGQDVTAEIRAKAVESTVSQVAQHSAVRDALVTSQRRAAAGPRAVVVGRDIGTVIFPDAAVKVFLDASTVERGRRRAAQSSAPADEVTIRMQLTARDRIDRERAAAPLVAARDAVIIDTDNLAIEDVEARILQLIRATGLLE